MYYLFLIIFIMMYCSIVNSNFYRQFQKAVKGPYFEGNRLDDIIEDQLMLEEENDERNLED